MKYLSCDTRPHLLPALEILFGSSIEMVIVSRLPVERKITFLLLDKNKKKREKNVALFAIKMASASRGAGKRDEMPERNGRRGQNRYLQ